MPILLRMTFWLRRSWMSSATIMRGEWPLPSLALLWIKPRWILEPWQDLQRARFLTMVRAAAPHANKICEYLACIQIILQPCIFQTCSRDVTDGNTHSAAMSIAVMLLVRRFKVFYVLEKPPQNWKGGSGYVTKEMIKKHLPPPGDDILITRCGPPAMNKAMRATLTDLGYTKDMQFEFWLVTKHWTALAVYLPVNLACRFTNLLPPKLAGSDDSIKTDGSSLEQRSLHCNPAPGKGTNGDIILWLSVVWLVNRSLQHASQILGNDTILQAVWQHALVFVL